MVPETTDESKQIVEYLKAHGFEEFTPSGLQINSSSRVAGNNKKLTLEEVKKIIEQFEELAKTERLLAIKSKVKSKSGRVQIPVCSTAGDYHIQEVAAGFASTWVIDYTITSNNSLDNVNIYVEGVPIGWSWDQQQVYLLDSMGF